MASVELDELHLSLGGNAVLNGVSLTLAQGEGLALLGPSGCGKTTTLRTIAGFVHADRGGVRFDGQPVDGLPPHRRNVGLVFQDYALFPHMTVARNVAYGLRMRRCADTDISRQVRQALDMVQLAGFEDRFPAQLSGGQRQRVALARAIVIKPDVLLLDEPLGALDRKLRDGMQVELKRLQRELGITTLIVTHDQEEALSLSDRVAVMFGGKIAAVDAPDLLYQRPARADVMAFLGRANFFDAQVERQSGVGQLRTVFGTRMPLDVASDREAGTRVRVGIRPEHLELRQAAPDPVRGEFAAIVADLIYRGSTAEVLLRVESEHGAGLSLSADLPASGLCLTRGDRVAARLPEAHCLTFDERESV